MSSRALHTHTPASSCLSAWTGFSLLSKGWAPRASQQERDQRVFYLGMGGCTVSLIPSLHPTPTFPKKFSESHFTDGNTERLQ